MYVFSWIQIRLSVTGSDSWAIVHLHVSNKLRFTPPPHHPPHHLHPGGGVGCTSLNWWGGVDGAWTNAKTYNPLSPITLKKGCGQEKNILTKQVCKSTFFTKRDSDTLQSPSQFHFHMGVTASSIPSPPSLPSSSSLPLTLLWLTLRERIAPNTCNHIPSWLLQGFH